jgi:hypothetical protein
MRTLETTRDIKDLSTDELLDFMYDLQYLYTPFFTELRRELTKRSVAKNEVFHRNGARWKCDTDTGGGCFVKLKGTK